MNQLERRPFLAWPGWPHLRFAWLETTLVAAWFAFVYMGANWVVTQRATRVRIHFDVELKLPLFPAFTVFYMSIYALLIAVPFILRTRREIKTLAFAQTIAIFVAGISFLLIPARLAFPPATDAELGMWRALFRFADRMNLDYNLVPSLHVALSFVCIEWFAPHGNAVGKALLRTWGALIAVSTWLTHQHHLVDVVTGLVLALVVVTLVRRTPH